MKKPPKIDLKKIAQTQLKTVTDQLTSYEKRAKQLVKDFELTGKDAKQKSRAQLDSVVEQLRKTRTELEDKVKLLVEKESGRIDKKVNDLFDTLLTFANLEKKQKAPKSSPARQSTKKPTKRKTHHQVKNSERKPGTNNVMSDPVSEPVTTPNSIKVK